MRLPAQTVYAQTHGADPVQAEVTLQNQLVAHIRCREQVR